MPTQKSFKKLNRNCHSWIWTIRYIRLYSGHMYRRHVLRSAHFYGNSYSPSFCCASLLPDEIQWEWPVDWYPSNPTLWFLGTLNLHPLLQDGLVNLLEAISKRPKMRTLLKKTLALMMPRDLSTSRQQLLNPSTVEEIDTSTNRDSIPMAHYQDGGK